MTWAFVTYLNSVEPDLDVDLRPKRKGNSPKCAQGLCWAGSSLYAGQWIFLAIMRLLLMRKETYLFILSGGNTYVCVGLMFWICLLLSAFHLTNQSSLYSKGLSCANAYSLFLCCFDFTTALKGPRCFRVWELHVRTNNIHFLTKYLFSTYY